MARVTTSFQTGKTRYVRDIPLGTPLAQVWTFRSVPGTKPKSDVRRTICMTAFMALYSLLALGSYLLLARPAECATIN
jgi:hypothetical protein